MSFGEDPLPRKFGRTILDARIGEGGMAEVFRARLIGQAFEKRVCVKRILPHLRRRPGFAEMFQDEARLLSGLQHEHIVHVFDFGDVDGALFLIMELIEGCSLADLLDHLQQQGQRLSVAQALKLGVALAGALAHAHAATRDGKPLGIVHRDVTPHNLLLGRDGAIKLTDFGVAHAADRQSRTETGALKGKLAYMSPEQAHGQDLDHRSDQFATGIVLWECLTGRRLFDGKSELNILEAVTQKAIARVSSVRGDVPPAVDAAIATMLQRDKRQRFADMTAVEAALKQALFQARRKPGDDDLRAVVAEATSSAPLVPTRPSGSGGAMGSAAMAGGSGPIVTLTPEPPRGTPVAAVVGGVVAALVVVAGIGVLSSRHKPKIVVAAGVSAAVVLPPVPVPVVLSSASHVAGATLPEVPLPALARRAGAGALRFGGGTPAVGEDGGGSGGVLSTPSTGAADNVSTVVVIGDFDEATDVALDVRRAGTTRMVLVSAAKIELVLRRFDGAAVDKVAVIGPGTVRVADGGAAVDVVHLPTQPIEMDDVMRGGPAALRQAQSYAGLVDVVVRVGSPSQINIDDGPLGAGLEELIASPADRDALRATLDRVAAHPESCARRCDDVAATTATAETWRAAVTAAAVETIRREVAPCIACLEAMGAP